MNRVEIIGNLGHDPELRYTGSGMAQARFTVATNRRYRSQQGETVEETQWFRVVAWGELAEKCDQYLRKGRKVFVAGRIQSRRYLDKDGGEREGWEVVATEVEFLDRPAEERGGRGDAPAGESGKNQAPTASPAPPRRTGRAAAPARPAPRQAPSGDGDSHDVPF